jgi:hypothetical protein
MEAYNTLFLEGGYTTHVLKALLPVLLVITLMQGAAMLRLRKMRLI